MTTLKQLILKIAAVATVSSVLMTPSANAAVSVDWDFSPGNENG
ncbi:MAG: hypothetical protein ACI8UZ_000992, partial [Akkermansiaceae bacterium]